MYVWRSLRGPDYGLRHAAQFSCVSIIILQIRNSLLRTPETSEQDSPLPRADQNLGILSYPIY